MKKQKNSLLNFKAKSIDINTKEHLTEFLNNGFTYPLVIKAEVDGVDLSEWYKRNREEFEQLYTQHGAVLLRNFNVNEINGFSAFSHQLDNNVLSYTQQSSPRTEVSDKIYTSTDYPADQQILMHNELSYSHSWPRNILFYALTPSEEGGETPICSNAEVTKKIAPRIIARFREHGILYMRNLNDKLGLAWQKVFQTNDPNEVERYCTENNMTFEWKSKDNLSIKWKRPALIIHPVTKEELWFNHGFFFNKWSLSSSYAEAFSAADLPFNTFYGNGEEIEKEVIENISNAYESTKSIFKWKKNDVLVLDNMRMAHGRNSFTGTRKILVSMSSAY